MKIDKEFVDKYDRLIRERVNASSGPYLDQDEIVSKVYERLLTHFSYDKERGTFTTWLGWVVRSVCSNEIKKRSHSKDALDHSVTLEEANSIIGQEDAGTADDELDRICNAALKKSVSPYDMRIFKEKHIEGLTVAEVAARHMITQRSVEGILYRTMKALREYIFEG